MCGICGIASARGTVDPGRLAAMSSTLVHRGPDSDGTYVDGPIGLAARRLAIIDLQTGDQPITREEHGVTVVQNGEIYNYEELRRELRARRSSLLDERRHRGADPPLRAARRAVRGTAARHVRDRAVGFRAPTARARSRPLRDQAALLPGRRRRARVRLRAARAPARRDRPRRARRVPRVQLGPGAAHDLPRRQEAPARAPPGVGGRARSSSPATRGPHRSRRARCAATRRPSSSRSCARGSATRCARISSPTCRSASSSREASTRPCSRRSQPRSVGAAAHVLDRVRGAELRRARRRAARRRALRHASTASSCCGPTPRSCCPRSPRPSTSRSPTRPRFRPTSSRSWRPRT